MSPYRTVRATQDDLPTVERIARLTWPATFSGILSLDQIEYMLDRMYSQEALRQQLSEHHVFHLLLHGEPGKENEYSAQRSLRYRAVGYVSHQLDYLPGTTKIHKIYLLPGVQGRGYGRVLIDRVAGIARAAGQEQLRLDVNYQNRAVDFYEHLGFVKIDRHDTDIGNGFLMEDWRMEKRLRKS